MPHMLIAGTTGSGKSVCVNAIISCLLLENTPDDLQMIMVDPKRVELTGYNGIPHLVSPVVVDLERIVGVLKWVTREMEERYKKFSASGARNIVDYNGKIGPHDETHDVPGRRRGRTGRPDDARARRDGEGAHAPGPNGPRDRHPSDYLHAAA